MNAVREGVKRVHVESDAIALMSTLCKQKNSPWYTFNVIIGIYWFLTVF